MNAAKRDRLKWQEIIPQRNRALGKQGGIADVLSTKSQSFLVRRGIACVVRRPSN